MSKWARTYTLTGALLLLTKSGPTTIIQKCCRLPSRVGMNCGIIAQAGCYAETLVLSQTQVQLYDRSPVKSSYEGYPNGTTSQEATRSGPRWEGDERPDHGRTLPTGIASPVCVDAPQDGLHGVPGRHRAHPLAIGDRRFSVGSGDAQ